MSDATPTPDGLAGLGTEGPDRGQSLRELADAVSSLAEAMSGEGGHAALQRLVDRAAQELVGARWASITMLQHGRFRTLVANDEVAEAIDAAQYRFGSGPCVDAVLEDATFLAPDLRTEQRWHPLGRLLHDDLGVASMLAYRLHLLDESEGIAALNLASDQRDAFSPADVHRGLVLASHGALIVTAHTANTRAEQLLRALESNREIGVAVGVLMARYRLTRQQAFDVLRVASQKSNRKLIHIATQVADTGEAPT